jgi:hypothetical protein
MSPGKKAAATWSYLPSTCIIQLALSAVLYSHSLYNLYTGCSQLSAATLHRQAGRHPIAIQRRGFAARVMQGLQAAPVTNAHSHEGVLQVEMRVHV